MQILKYFIMQFSFSVTWNSSISEVSFTYFLTIVFEICFSESSNLTEGKIVSFKSIKIDTFRNLGKTCNKVVDSANSSTTKVYAPYGMTTDAI